MMPRTTTDHAEERGSAHEGRVPVASVCPEVEPPAPAGVAVSVPPPPEECPAPPRATAAG
ncbi:MAG: hypothetical protein AAF715_23090 [Myxococcota bacterium]